MKGWQLEDCNLFLPFPSSFGDFGLLLIFIREDLFNAMQHFETGSGYALKRVENVWQETKRIAGISWEPMAK